MHKRILLIAAAVVPLATFHLPLEAVGQQELTVERVIGSGEFQPDGLPSLAWTPDGEAFTWLQRRPESPVPDLLREEAGSGRRSVVIDGSTLVPPGESRPLEIEGYQWGPNGRRMLLYTRTQRVWRLNTKGVYFVYDVEDGELRPLSTAFGWQQFAKFSPDGRRVAFVRENDLFVVELESMEERRLTSSGSEMIINGTFDWVYEEELGLRDGWRWSPDSRKIAYWQLDQTPIRTFNMIDDLELYSRPIPLPYPKAGDPNSVARIGVLDLASGETTWMDTGDNPDVYLARMEWAETPSEIVIQRMNRHQNRIDVLLADVGTGQARVLFTEESGTWVDVDDDMTWVEDGSRFVWTSERDGFEHIYLYDRDGTLVRQLTEGEWVAGSPQAVTDEWVYFTAARETPLGRQLYRVALAGGEPERLTEGPGWHGADVSPTGAYFVDSWSQAGDPPRYTLRAGDGTAVRGMVTNDDLRERLGRLDLQAPEFFEIETPGGVTLNAWRILPPGFDATLEYPVVMYVYGGPGSQTVTDSWGGGRYLWHQLLAQRGYVVVSVDNRGTGARGTAFKNATYLQLGRIETDDQVAAARWIGAQPWADADRIGIWGWSYGGFMTLMALTAGEGVFAAGVSVAPVTSWRFYDTIYTERYMRTPRENPEGYGLGPLYRAADLSGELLLVHGTGDDNVHFQNSVQMVDRLVAAGRPFDVMIYPNKTHAIGGRETQRHLYRMMLDFWLEHLPVGEGSAGARAGTGR
jgi:dipeptidyl-peptidase-4